MLDELDFLIFENEKSLISDRLKKIRGLSEVPLSYEEERSSRGSGWDKNEFVP